MPACPKLLPLSAGGRAGGRTGFPQHHVVCALAGRRLSGEKAHTGQQKPGNKVTHRKGPGTRPGRRAPRRARPMSACLCQTRPASCQFTNYFQPSYLHRLPSRQRFSFLKLNHDKRQRQKAGQPPKPGLATTATQKLGHPCLGDISYEGKGSRAGSRESGNRAQPPRHSLNYNFYRKFYSTYNIFQQKGNIQEELVYTATETNRKYWKRMESKCDLRILFYLHSKLDAAGISSKTKKNKVGTEIKLHTMNINISETLRCTQPKSPPSGELYMFIH